MKTKLLLLIFLFPFFAQKLIAQENNLTYKNKLAVHIPVGIVTLGLGGTALILQKKHNGLTLDQINALQITDVNKFDRSAIFRKSHPCAVTSDVFQIGSMIAPSLLFFDKKARQEYKTILPMWIETFALTTALTSFTKEIVRRNRPFAYNPNIAPEKKMGKGVRTSFFSGHTSISASSTFFMAKVFADLHPNSKYKPLMWTGAALIPAITGLCRYGAGKHYFTDIIIGYAIGATVGILVPQLHKIKNKP